jgi:hypothetical protein
LFPRTFKLFVFPNFRFWAYLMKVIPEMWHVHSIWYLRFYYSPKSKWLFHYIIYIILVSFIGGGNQNTLRKLPTCSASHVLYRVHIDAGRMETYNFSH